MEYKGLTLDQFQVDAIHSIEANHSVVVSAPTGSGKTLIADYIINRDVKKGIKVIYTAPIKALSNQKYKQFKAEYGEDKVGLITGDIVRNPTAPILIMTTEIYRNMAILDDPMLHDLSYVIFDEIHYINDIERGVVWEESIIFSKPHIRFLCLSATIPNADEFASWIQAISKHKVDVILHDIRIVPLHKTFFDAEIGIATLEEIRDITDVPSYEYIRGKSKRRKKRAPFPDHVDLIREIPNKLPCLFFDFSRKRCQEKALQLSKTRIFKPNNKIITFVRQKLEDVAPEIRQLKSTKLLRQTLPLGIGFHHAGLIPILKEIVEDLFSEGLINVLYTTETFAVGINMPAKAVCFDSLRKFDGVNFRLLNTKEYFQIAGRAGRRGIDKEGFVYAMINRNDFDYKAVKKLTKSDTDPVISQFKLSVNTVLNLIKRHDADEIQYILCKSFYAYQKYGQDFNKMTNNKSHHKFVTLKKRLQKMGYVDGDALTEKGEFASKIYADEIIIGEVFGTDMYTQLNTYQTLLLLAGICYESRQRTEFYKSFKSKDIGQLMKILQSHPYLKRQKRFENLFDITAMVHPCFHGESIFKIIDNTNLLEGDIIRFFRQILDRIGQIKNATNNQSLCELMDHIQHIVVKCIEDVDTI